MVAPSWAEDLRTVRAIASRRVTLLLCSSRTPGRAGNQRSRYVMESGVIALAGRPVL